jgi:hypothetical protein
MGQSDPIRFSFNPKHWLWSTEEWKPPIKLAFRGRWAVDKPDLSAAIADPAKGPIANLPTLVVKERIPLAVKLDGGPVLYRQTRVGKDGHDFELLKLRTMVVNADAWCEPDLAAFASGWDGERVRLLVAGRDDFDAGAAVAAALMPWPEVVRFRPEPMGLYESSWRAAHDQGRLEVVRYEGPFVDCGTPARYLAANLAAAELVGGSIVGPAALIDGDIQESVVGHDAVVSGRVRHSVVWDHATVHLAERLDHAIRADDHLTVLLR